MNHKHIARYGISLILLTLIFGTIYGTVQQNFRSSANDPQIQMAEDVAYALNHGALPETVVSKNQIDIRQSLAPFVVIYDAKGEPLIGSGILDGKTPRLPKGVFDSVMRYGEDRVTWQPDKEVRIASVIIPFNSGFILAGRSLREVEKRESKLEVMITLGWLGCVMLMTAVFFLFRGKEH